MSGICYNTGVGNLIKATAAVLVTPRGHDTRKGNFLMRSDHTRVPYFPANLDDYAPWVSTYGLTAPYGKCQCGCGATTAISTVTHIKKAGVRRGQPRRYCRGHAPRQMSRPQTVAEISPDTREIVLTRGKVAIVDAADYEWLNQWQWHARSDGYVWYAARHERLPDGTQVTIRMHRQILGAVPGALVDHCDMNGLNNRRSNLRLASMQENQRNRNAQSNNTSGYKGVSWHQRHGKWYAHITVDGRRKHLGHFDTAEEAANAYNEAACIHYGEFARLNKVGA